MEEHIDTDQMFHGQEQILKFIFNFADSMVLKCAVELHIADIIHSHGHPITLQQIISSTGSPSPDIACLERIMRFLVNRKIFTANPQLDGGDTLYGMTPASRWILRDAELSLAPFLLLENDERNLASWHHLSNCVREGGDGFEKAYGLRFWEYASSDPRFFKLYNEGMQCTANIFLKAICESYKDGFERIVGTLVDVGGGSGAALAEIVKAHPHIKGINFDQPQVVAKAPEYPGISHVGGDMFKTIPNANTIFMKTVLHNWSDDDCVKILKNCRESIPEDTGKLILLEIVLSSETNDMFDMGLVFDLLMMAHHKGGKERNEQEWKALLDKAGFTRTNIIKLPLLSIIEAYPY